MNDESEYTYGCLLYTSLIVGADAVGICVRITGGVVVLQPKVRLPWQVLRPIAAAHDRCARMYRIVAVAATLQIPGARRIKPQRQLRLIVRPKGCLLYTSRCV